MLKSEILYYPNMEPSLHDLRSYLLFFDKVNSIVSKDSIHLLSEETKRLMDDRDGSFTPLEPPKDQNLSSLEERDLLKRTLKAYNKSIGHRKKNQIKMSFYPSGKMEIEGYSFLKDSNIEYKIKEIINDSDLMIKDGDGFAKGLGLEGFQIVNSFVSMIIMARLSDIISNKKGIPTITNVPWAYSINGAATLGIDNRQTRRGHLANCILKMSVPADLSILKESEFERIRDRYKGIRELFSEYLYSPQTRKIEEAEDEREIHDLINNLSIKFEEELLKIKCDSFISMTKKWAPILIGAGTFISQFTGFGPVLTGLINAANFSVTIGQETGFFERNNDRNLHKLINGLHDDIEHSIRHMRLIGD